MEKNFIYPLIFESSDVDTTTDIAALRGKLYRTLLEQRTATEHVWLGSTDRNQSADAAHA
jgi:hypothetical protein